MRTKTKGNHPKVDANQAIEEGMIHKNFLNKFQDWLIITMHKFKAEDIISKTRNMNTRYEYPTNGSVNSSALDPLNIFCKEVGYHTPHTQRDLYGSQIQILQQYFYNLYCKSSNKKPKKPIENNPTVVLDSMIEVVDKTEIISGN